MRKLILTCAALSMATAWAIDPRVPPIFTAGERAVPATYIMVCCHAADRGTKFLLSQIWLRR